MKQYTEEIKMEKQKRKQLKAKKGAVRVATVGCGLHAILNIYPCLPRISEIDLVAVCDLKKELAQQNARYYGAKVWYTDFEKMIDTESPDGVIVVGPPPMQYQIGKKILERGIPIFIEKPVTWSIEESETLQKIAEEKNCWGQVGYMKRFSIPYQIAKHIIEKGDLGRITQITCKYACGKYPPKLWNLPEPKMCSLLGHEVHIIDLFRFFGGDIEELFAMYHCISEEQHGYCVSLRFKSGAIGSLSTNSFERWENFDEYLSISGEEAYIVVDQMARLKFYPRNDWVTVPKVNIQNLSMNWATSGRTSIKTEDRIGYYYELKHFATCLKEKKKPSVSLEDGIQALKTAYAIFESSQSKRPIKLI